jgi:hypothetical protein
MRIIEVALRYSTLGYGIPLSISSLFLRREYGRVQRRAAEKRRNQTSNLRVGGSNPSERASKINYSISVCLPPAVEVKEASGRRRAEQTFGCVIRKGAVEIQPQYWLPSR